jgi:hypothetical protein
MIALLAGSSCEYKGVWKLFYDWQSLIAGMLALFAGFLAYGAGRRQALATEAQNIQMRRRERCDLAREVLISTRLFDGILATVLNNISDMATFSTAGSYLGVSVTNSIRQKLAVPSLYPVIDYLGKLGRESIGNYFELLAKVEQFRTPTADTTGAQLNHEVEAIRAIINVLRNDIAEEARKTQEVLADASSV